MGEPEAQFLIDVINQVANPLATFLAALVGSLSAFRLKDNADRRRQVENEIDAGNRALFSLFQQLNTLGRYQRAIINPVRTKPSRVFEMRPSLQEDPAEFSIDLKDLSFLLSTKHKQILCDLFIEDQRYRQAIKAINHRSELHYRECQPVVDRNGWRDGGAYSEQAFRSAVGERLFSEMVESTNNVVEHVDKTVVSLERGKDNLVAALKDLYPASNLLYFSLLSDENANDGTERLGRDPRF